MKPAVQFLSSDEVRTIHTTALEILFEVGMRFPAEEALSVFAKAGAAITDTDLVKIPPDIVKKALETVPKRNEAVLYAVDPQQDVRFVEHDPFLACMTMATSVIDPYTDEVRSATDEDLARLTRLADGLDCIAVNGGLVTPQDVAKASNDWSTWATCMKNTTKHITGGVYGYRGVLDAIEMGGHVCGSREKFLERPFISGWVLTMPPLAMDTVSTEAMMEMNRHKIPIMLSSGPIIGTTAPVTIAGMLAQTHAEILACIALSQCIREGAPVVYTSFARGMNMKTSNISMGGPEFAILKAGMSQLGLFLDLPVRMPAMLRDAKVLDAQAGFETGLVGTLASFTADIMDSMQLDTDLVVDYADLLFCTECMAIIRHALRPLVVNSETLAKDVIAEIGPSGDFLGHQHTFTRFKKEIYHPEIFDQNNRETWETQGAKDVRQRCIEKVRILLSKDTTQRVDDTVAQKLDAIVAQAVKDMESAG